MTCCFFAEGKIGAVNAEDTRIASRCRSRGGHLRARNKAQFHQTPGNVFGEIDVVKDGVFPKRKLGERPASFETRLHL